MSGLFRKPKVGVRNLMHSGAFANPRGHFTASKYPINLAERTSLT